MLSHLLRTRFPPPPPWLTRHSHPPPIIQSSAAPTTIKESPSLLSLRSHNITSALVSSCTPSNHHILGSTTATLADTRPTAPHSFVCFRVLASFVHCSVQVSHAEIRPKLRPCRSPAAHPQRSRLHGEWSGGYTVTTRTSWVMAYCVGTTDLWAHGCIYLPAGIVCISLQCCLWMG